MQSFEKVTVLLALGFLITGCTSISADSVSTMLVTFSSNFPQIKNLIFAFAYLAGFALIISGVKKLKNVTNPSGSYSQTTTPTGALGQIFIGVALLALPSFIKMMVYSLWGTDSIMQISGFSGGTLPVSVDKAILGLIQILGYISVVRGLMILNKIAKMQTSQETMGKGILHIIGGILSINIMATIKLIKNSFGL